MLEDISDGAVAVLIAGGAGYIGAHTCKALRGAGGLHEVETRLIPRAFMAQKTSPAHDLK